MKSLTRDEMKKIMGGETPDNCIRPDTGYCYNWCVNVLDIGAFDGICRPGFPNFCVCLT